MASADKDMLFICALLKDPHLFEEVVTNKVTASYLTKDASKIYTYMLEFFHEYGKVPAVETTEKKFGAFYEVPPENIAYYIGFLKNREKFNLIKKTTGDLLDVISNSQDVEKSLKVCEEMLTGAATRLSLELSDAKIVDITQNAESRFSNYEKRKLGVDGIHTPWEPLTSEIFGWQSGDLNTILGESGLGKSWALLLCMIEAYMYGHKVLLFTEEMTIAQLATRFDAIMAKLPYEKFRKASLGDEGEQKYKDFLVDISTNSESDFAKPFIIIQDIGDKGLDGIYSSIRLFKPDIVGIDGAYLFSESYDWKAVSELTKGLKKIAQSTMTPILVTNQKADNMDKSAYSASFIRDSSYVIVMYQDPDRKDLPIMSFKLIKSRDIRKSLAWETEWDFDDMSFSLIKNAIYDQEEYVNYA
jgi:archaellum biogenesis ATPase FlaH